MASTTRAAADLLIPAFSATSSMNCDFFIWGLPEAVV
jgi:hypothetical protein